MNRLSDFAGRDWDVIYFPWNSVAISMLPVFDRDCPVILSCRGTQVHVKPFTQPSGEYAAELRATFERAKAVHCVSDATKEIAVSLGLKPSQARVIRPGVDTERFRQTGKLEHREASEPLKILMIGTLAWVKGYEYALQAIQLLLNQGVKCTVDIVGDGVGRQRVAYTVDDLGLTGAVTLHGRLPENEVLRLLQTTDVLLLSSVSEGISNAVLEAMACEVPVVVTDCGGMREAVTDGVEGFVVPVRDSAALADRLALLAKDQDLRRRLGIAGRQRVIRDFNLEQHTDAWSRLLQATARTTGPAELCVCE